MTNPASPGIEPNMPQDIGARTAQATGQAGQFQDIYDGLGYGMGMAAPVIHASMQTYRPEGADIVNAAVSATAGYGYGVPGAYSGASANYGIAGGRGMSAQTVNGSIGVGIGGAAPGGNDVIGQSQQILAESQASSVAMLMLQDEMGQQGRYFTAISNGLSQRDQTHRQIIGNLKG